MIFEDPSGHRWKIVIRIFFVLIFITCTLIGLSFYSYSVNSVIPIFDIITEEDEIILESNQGQAIGNVKGIATNSSELTPKEKEIMDKVANEVYYQTLKLKDFLSSGFLTEASLDNIGQALEYVNKLDIVFTDWLSFDVDEEKTNVQVNERVIKVFHDNKKVLIPRATNSDDKGNWLGLELSNYIRSTENRKDLSQTILDVLLIYGLPGVIIDFQEIEIWAREDYLDFLDRLRTLLHKNNKCLIITVPMDDYTVNYNLIGNMADFVVVMPYENYYVTDDYNLFGSQERFKSTMDNILIQIPKEKVIIALGQYSYDYNISQKTIEKRFSFDETMLLANEMKENIKADNKESNKLMYADNDGDKHCVYVEDAISLWNNMQYVKELQVIGTAIWRLGVEDPSVWEYYAKEGANEFDLEKLNNVKTLNDVNYLGKGEILKVISTQKIGKRNINFKDNIIESSEYNIIPSSYVIDKSDKGEDKNIILTFDDGPDPNYTEKILDILKENDVKATFFVVGKQIQKFPETLKRIIREGHIIGNHTYGHADLGKTPTADYKIEINKAQRLVEAITGRQTILLRTPYNTVSEISDPKHLDILYEASNMGYFTVAGNIDSKDYESNSKYDIINNVLNGLDVEGTKIIVMHDAGGESRNNTVEALKILIPVLKDNGYKFINLDDLMGISNDKIMPIINLDEQLMVMSNKVINYVYSNYWSCITVLFYISTYISLFRILFLGYFVLFKALKSKKALEFKPFVSVIIPAYNEEKVIEKTIRGVLRSNYESLEVIVVDDGSTDGTKGVVEKFVAANEKVRLISKENGGKFSALNLGFAQAKADYIVTIDADTMILPNTITNLIAPFADDTVDAVCGNVQVGNIKNIITGFQAVEYITSQNYDRRAFESLNCISVVPGATGAWRKSKVIEIGGYSNQTLTEDADLTLTMLAAKGKIVYAANAKSITEAPETITALFKQRFRWSYGTFQCLWKHKKCLFKGTLGWVALPNILVFQILFPIISPIGDFVFILSLLRGDMQAILVGYLIFLAMDLVASIIAFALEKAPMKYIAFVLIQRFFYRQFMYVVAFKSIVAAIVGKRHGWNKLKRTNSVQFG